jgi:hypothetical protein
MQTEKLIKTDMGIIIFFLLNIKVNKYTLKKCIISRVYWLHFYIGFGLIYYLVLCSNYN